MLSKEIDAILQPLYAKKYQQEKEWWKLLRSKLEDLKAAGRENEARLLWNSAARHNNHSSKKTEQALRKKCKQYGLPVDWLDTDNYISNLPLPLNW